MTPAVILNLCIYAVPFKRIFPFSHSFRWSHCSGKTFQPLQLPDSVRLTFPQPAEIEEGILWRCCNPGITWRRSRSHTDSRSRWTHDAPPAIESSCEAWQSFCSIVGRIHPPLGSRTVRAVPARYGLAFWSRRGRFPGRDKPRFCREEPCEQPGFWMRCRCTSRHTH